MLKYLNLRAVIATGLLLVLTACGTPSPKNTAGVNLDPVGGEVPYVVPSRYMRTGHQPVTPAEFEAAPFANFESTGARDVVVNLTGLSVGIGNLSLERFVRIVRGQDHEVEREWRDCPANFITVPQNMQWFERDRYETAFGVEQCLWLKGPGDRNFKAVFSLGCHNPIGAEITRIVRQLINDGNERIIKRPPPVVEPPVEPPVCEGDDCNPEPPCVGEDCVEPPVEPPVTEGCAGNPGNNKCVGKATENPTGDKVPHFESSGSGGSGDGSTGASTTSQEGDRGPHEGTDVKTSKERRGSSTAGSTEVDSTAGRSGKTPRGQAKKH